MLQFTGMIMNGCEINKKSSALQPAKLYIANEEGCSFSILDLQNSLKNMSVAISDSRKMFMAHNVQSATDGKTVWLLSVSMDSTGINQLSVIDVNTVTI